MKAIVSRPRGGFALQEVQTPALGSGEALLAVKAAGLCGTDLAKLAEPGAGQRPLGHEIAGVIHAVAPDVTRLAVGDRVVAAHHVPCGRCWACRHGSESMCRQFKATNIEPGGFAEFVRLSALHVQHVAFRLPAELAFDAAAFTEPLACAVRAVERSAVQPGDRIGVFGGGGMGLLIAQVLAARGAVPVVVEVSESRLALARALRVKETVNPAREDLARVVAETTGGAGLDGVVLTVATAAVLAQAQRLVRAGGRINVFAGPAEGPLLPLDFGDLYHRELSVCSTYSATPATLAAALDLLATNQVQVLPLISHRLPLTAFEEGVRLQRSGQAVKVIFQP
ncbi:MAG: alcohol dehydrogenase catalytic domain-containing protein [Candidatus Methylomirabilales bacterium]